MTTVIETRRPFSQAQLVAFAAASLGIDMVWATAAGFLPPMLERLGAKPLAIGLLMGAGPMTGLLVQPLAGLFSDRISTTIGRRLPFILIGAPLAICSLIGLAYANSLLIAGLFIALLCIAINAYQGPYRAILGDQIEPAQHGLASSFMNIASGLGMLLAFTLGSLLIKYHDGAPFWLAALMVLISTTWTSLSVDRQPPRSVKLKPSPPSELFKFLLGKRTLLVLFGCQFCCWFAIQAASGFAVLYAVHELKGVADIASPAGKAAASDAVLLLAVVTVTVLIAAVPMALLAARFGKRIMLTIGVAIMLIGFLLATVATTIAQTYPVMMLFGIGFAAVQVIPFTILTELQPPGHEGALAGVFNIFVALPQLLALNLVGALIERTGSYRTAFSAGAVALVVALVLLPALKIPHKKTQLGEPES